MTDNARLVEADKVRDHSHGSMRFPGDVPAALFGSRSLRSETRVFDLRVEMRSPRFSDPGASGLGHPPMNYSGILHPWA